MKYAEDLIFIAPNHELAAFGSIVTLHIRKNLRCSAVLDDRRGFFVEGYGALQQFPLFFVQIIDIAA